MQCTRVGSTGRMAGSRPEQQYGVNGVSGRGATRLNPRRTLHRGGFVSGRPERDRLAHHEIADFTITGLQEVKQAASRASRITSAIVKFCNREIVKSDL